MIGNFFDFDVNLEGKLIIVIFSLQITGKSSGKLTRIARVRLFELG